MADSNIGALPQAPSLADDSLMVVEQQGTAMKMTGAQFKEFGKQGVIQDVQDLVDDAQAAADSAESAVSAVVDMTVEASTLDNGAPATVTKTMKQGKVNLAFGLPRGARGVPGPKGDTGDTGQRGPKGDPGAGLDIVGRYDSTDDVPNPQEGKSYYIGTTAPYDLCTYINGAWVNNGPISGGGGGVIPEDVVTSEGGASFEYGTGAGDAPHLITFTTEEEPPLTAEDVNYSDTQTVKDAIDGLKSSVSNGKTLIASAITDKGVTTAQDATFAQMAQNIGQISTGTDTSDATAAAADILSPKTAYTASGKVTGRIPSLAAQTITPGTSAKSIASGQYLAGPQTVVGEPNLTSSNIKKGVSIFGVVGAVESSFKATLTVTVDVGAVVTATKGSQSISALSTTGTVVMELPSEGTWSITAARGLTQYNTAIITVASTFSVELDPTVYIEHFAVTTPLSEKRAYLAAATVGDYALFAGGEGDSTSVSAGNPGQSKDAVDVYDTDLTHLTATPLGSIHNSGSTVGIRRPVSAVVGSYALFAAGGVYYNVVYAYNENLTQSTPTAFGSGHTGPASATIGNYAIFAGGTPYSNSTAVDAYDNNLTRSSPGLPLVQGRADISGITVGGRALFAGGVLSSGDKSDIVETYDEELTRSTITPLSIARVVEAAANAGGFALLTAPMGLNGVAIVDAYDVTLTRTSAPALSETRSGIAATTLKGYAMFGGGYKFTGLDSYTFFKTMELYDQYLTKRTDTSLSEGRGYFAATAIGNYALFAGGVKSISSVGQRKTTSAVDAYRYVL